MIWKVKMGVSPSTTLIFIHLFPQGRYKAPTEGRAALFRNRKAVSDFFQFICG
jgi:hypothetical protein